MTTKEITISTARYIAALLVALNKGGELPEKPGEVEYRRVFALAKRHSVASAIWYVIEDEVRATGDDELISRFIRECDLAYAQNLVQTREFAAVCNAFTKAGIRFLPIKGFINKALWLKPEYRTMSDMDIFVSPDTAEAAAEALKSIGYVFDHGGSVHDSYVKPPYVNIELHKSLGSYGDGDFNSWVPTESNPYHFVMRDEDYLVYLLDHMYKHYKSGGNGMRSFFDLYLFHLAKGASLDKAYIEGELRWRGLDEFYSLANRLSALWFGGESACSDELIELEYYIITGGTFGTVENRVEHALKTRSRFGYLLSRIFLPYSSMKSIYPWLKPLPFLLPIAWVMRLLKALFDGRMRRELRATNNASRLKRDSASPSTTDTEQ